MIIALIITTLIISAGIYLLGNKTLAHVLSYLYCLFLGYFTFYQYQHLDELQLSFFRPDSLSILFLAVLSILGFTTTYHYQRYAKARDESKKTVKTHKAVYILFLGALVGVNMTNHFGLLWAFIEGTTITGAVLIYHDRDKLALEAVWKYVFVASISIALAFAGILFLSIGMQEVNAADFDFDSIALVANQFNPFWVKATFLFVLIGFSVKMGIVPMFNVDIDAKDVSPSPISAMLSSVLMNAGFLAIFRFYVAFSGSGVHSWMNHVLIIVGVLSILFATAYIGKVGNFKRIFAYSSMEHAGLIMIALAFGKLGAFAAILHILYHSLVKSSLFYHIGQVHRIFKSKHDFETGGYFYINPLGGIILLFGVLSVIALPPTGLFVSEFLIFKTMLSANHIWITLFVMLLLTIIMYTFSKSLFKLLFTKPEIEIETTKEKTNLLEAFFQLSLLGSVAFLGLAQPQFISDLINQSIHLLP